MDLTEAKTQDMIEELESRNEAYVILLCQPGDERIRASWQGNYKNMIEFTSAILWATLDADVPEKDRMTPVELAEIVLQEMKLRTQLGLGQDGIMKID